MLTVRKGKDLKRNFNFFVSNWEFFSAFHFGFSLSITNFDFQFDHDRLI